MGKKTKVSRRQTGPTVEYKREELGVLSFEADESNTPSLKALMLIDRQGGTLTLSPGAATFLLATAVYKETFAAGSNWSNWHRVLDHIEFKPMNLTEAIEYRMKHTPAPVVKAA